MHAYFIITLAFTNELQTTLSKVQREINKLKLNLKRDIRYFMCLIPFKRISKSYEMVSMLCEYLLFISRTINAEEG